MFERTIILTALIAVSYLIFKNPFMKTNNEPYKGIFDKFNLNPELPTVLYFWTEQCTQCKFSQKPALKRLKQNEIDFNFISVNALEDKELVGKFSIKTVPTTAVFNSKREFKFINSGFANEQKLKEQLAG